ncbi:MAG: SUMF1/EgtB/PvdO family nonheme iron enzyme [Planctomycetota bacterium]
MADKVPDEAFARAANQMGAVKLVQIEAAKAVQAEKARQGAKVSLADVLIEQGLLTVGLRENIEEKAQAQQQGGLARLGPYKLLKKLGEGGMGAVYLADDTAMGRKVALKILPKKHAGDSEFLSRFRREARASGQLNHVNIVCAYSTGEEMGHHFIVMEYCEGEALDKLLKREQRLPWDKAVEVVMQVARGLKHAHEQGIIHRDIKPANIMLCQAQGDGPRVAKILDMGLSKQLGESEQSFQTASGAALGTPHYISPEQANGDKNIDGHTDIYSLGATFYHLVTGQTPFQAPTAMAIMMKHINEQLPNPQDIVEDLPDGVVHVIQKMMAKAPADRYANCKELLDDLELVIDGKMPSSHAIEHGRSSVAVARVARPKRPAGIAQAPSHAAGHPVGTRQQQPVAELRRTTGRDDVPLVEVPPSAPSRKALYIGAGVLGLGALILLLVLMMGGGGEKSETRSSKLEGNSKNETKKTGAAGQAGNGTKTTAQALEETRLKEAAAKLEVERKLEADKRKAEEAKLEEEKRKLAEGLRKLEEARLAVEAEAKNKAENATTKVEPTPVQPDTKVAQPDTKAGETPTAQTDARAAKAQQPFSAVLKETAPLLAQNKFADAIALLERKAKNPALADAAELLKQEKADVESVLELRKAAIEALRKQVGQQITLKKGGTAFKGKVVNEPKPDAVTLDMSGAQMTFNLMQLSLDDVDQYAPRSGNVGADLRQRGIMYLASGNVAKAKEYFTKPQTLNPESYLDRITAIELGEIEAAALKSWEKAEKLFTAKDMRGAKAAYEAFERDHGKTQTAAKQAAALKERYDAIEKVLGPAPTLTLDLGGGAKMEMVLIKAGEFMMGADNEGCNEEKPAHKVKISKPFYMGKFHVTVAQFRAFVDAMKFQTEAEKAGNKGWGFDGQWHGLSNVNWKQPNFQQEDTHPVCLVTWNDAQEFCKWAAKNTGRNVCLPTEAQWEYACRAGTTTRYNTGDKDSDLDKAAWFEGNSGHKTHPVGLKVPNAWGLYDMHGNLWQWCADRFQSDYYKDSPPADPPGPTVGGERVLRGGSWFDIPDYSRDARRHGGIPGHGRTNHGFRCALDF